jgi:hypothetical protein
MADLADLVDGRFPITRGSVTLNLAYASNSPIDRPSGGCHRILFSLHGSGDNAPLYLANAVEAAQRRPGSLAQTLIVAPQFLRKSNISGSVPPDVLHWEDNPFWGADSSASAAFRVSSFDCLDLLAEALLNRSLFPNVLLLVIAGHSGGGQMVNRYAASSRRIRELADTAGVRILFVPMNAGNYLYMDNKRPRAGSTTTFTVPDALACAHYDAYGLGLQSLTYGYHTRGAINQESIRRLYRDSCVTYLIGEDDDSLDPNDDAYKSMPKGCADNLQGAQRRARAQAYHAHVKAYYGSSIAQTHVLRQVPGVGHWGKGMMTSDVGVETLFAPVKDFSVQVLRAADGGQLNQRLDAREWSDGWTQAKAFVAGGRTYLFLLKTGTGDVHVHRLNGNGTIGDEVKRYTWTPGWSTVSFYAAGGRSYLFLLKAADGRVHVHRMNDDGTVGDRVDERDWSDGWTHGEPFYVGPYPFLFLVKQGTGEVHVHQIQPDGRVGVQVGDYSWSAGWTTASFYYVAGVTYLLLLKSGDGALHTHRMNLNGTVGPTVEDKDWSSGWTGALPFAAGNTAFVLFLKEGDGRVEIRKVNLNGSLGGYVQRTAWSRGWTSLTSYASGSRTHVLALKRQKLEC